MFSTSATMASRLSETTMLPEDAITDADGSCLKVSSSSPTFTVRSITVSCWNCPGISCVPNFVTGEDTD